MTDLAPAYAAPEADRVLRGGAWNLKVGRVPGVVLAEVKALLLEHRLDFLVVVEAQGYVDLLERMLPKVGYRLLTDHTDPSARDSAVIVRSSLDAKAPRLHRLGTVRWERKPGRPGLHWSRSAVAAEVEGVKVLATHLPPGPFGPRFPLRRLAYAVALRRVRRILRTWRDAGKPFVAPGDWNKRLTEKGSWANPSPLWLVQGLGFQATSAGGIDYVVSDGVQVRRYRRVTFGRSDHRPVLFEVVR